MNNTMIIGSIVLVLILGTWIFKTGKKQKARLSRIRKVHAPEAKICYMDLRGRRNTWLITIESLRPKGQDWLITAWCHEKKGFFTYHASRIYEYVDLDRIQEIKNVPQYFTDKMTEKLERSRNNGHQRRAWPS